MSSAVQLTMNGSARAKHWTVQSTHNHHDLRKIELTASEAKRPSTGPNGVATSYPREYGDHLTISLGGRSLGQFGGRRTARPTRQILLRLGAPRRRAEDASATVKGTGLMWSMSK